MSLFLAEVTQICQSYQQIIEKLESEKWDLEQEVEAKDNQVWQLVTCISFIKCISSLLRLS